MRRRIFDNHWNVKTCSIFTLAGLILFLGTVSAQTAPHQPNSLSSVIPKPLNVQESGGSFSLNKDTKIVVEGGNVDLKAIGEKLSDQLENVTGYQLAVKEGVPSEKNSIVLSLNGVSDSLGDEGYALAIDHDRIVLQARKPAGIFYGTQTIYQLLPMDNVAQARASFAIQAGKIIDKPRFGWRGMMLDVGRYFYSVDFIKEYIDNLAMHKMNTFHWHLTEDHGWRIEIKKYPELTQVGAWRKGTQYDKSPRQVNENPHGGYYTQEQVSEIVKYAQERYVTIVPEVEMPGHALAALVTFPELSCTGGPFEMPVHWGIQKDVFCAGNEQTFEFLENVLTEIAELFPSPIIHIGGDECPKDRWKVCPKCQARMKTEGLKDEHELQSYFIKRIEDFLLTKNKRIIGWDEILEGGLAPNATVMSWRGVKGGIAAAKQHHDVIMAPTTFAYLDYYQGEPYLEPAAIGGLTTLEKSYSFEPISSELSPEEAHYIKGVQANVWSEYIHSPEKVQYMAFPRAAALAEVAWTQPELKDWDDFKFRMEKQYKRYESLGMNYSKSAYDVWISTDIDSTAKQAQVTLETNSYQPEIRYTTDGSEPTAHSLKYIKPFMMSLPGTVRSATFKEGKRVSHISGRSAYIEAGLK